MIDYDMPMGEYLSSPLLSTSKLKDLASRGARYFASRHITRTTPEPESTDAQVLGQLFEDIVQGRGMNRDAYAVKPEGMTFATKEGKAWRKEQLDAGKQIITADELRDLEWMHEAVLENETALELIRKCRKQVTLTGVYTGVPGLISRPDWLSVDGCAVSGYTPYSLDLKTTQTIGKLTSGRGIVDFRYDAQAAIVRECMRQTLGCKHSVHYLLACEKRQPYRVQVIEITPEWLDIGWQWCERQLQKLARHYEQNAWPRVDAEVVALPPPPPWASKDATEDDEAA